jgi:hypothetical protein
MPMLSRSAVVLLVLATVVGCRRSETASSDPATDAAAAAARDAGAFRVAHAEAEARAVMTAWLNAQNEGAFASYESLYAARFEGVRRSGTQTKRLDRARWMKERAAMFEQPMTVAAKDMVVVQSHEGADVRFVQTWTSGSYRDEGPKHVVLVRQGGALKIAREEMLKSQVANAASVAAERFAFTVHLPGAHLVLEDEAKDEWATGAPSTVSLGDPVVTRRAVDATKLPPDLAAWAGKKVELFGASGSACEGTVSTLFLAGRVVPHFGTMNYWSGTGDSAGEPKPPADVVAREAWDISRGGRLLVAEVKTASGDCKGALWGRASAPAKPVLTAGVPADATTAALALAELRKTKAWAATQADYLAQKEPQDPEKWDAFESKPVARVFAHPSGTTLVTLSIVSGTGCDNFGATLSGAWELKNGALTALKDASGDELVPLSAGDVDGDGKLELVVPEGLLRLKGAKYETANKLQVPFLDCGC